jgi:hypothetical protein
MPGFGGLLAFLLFLIYVAGIIAAFAVAIAIWSGMKAHERMADSMERMADAAERIEKIVRRDGEPGV